MCEPCKQDCLAKTTEAWAQAADERDRNKSALEVALLQIRDALFALGRFEVQGCPCGARPETPNTHPHVIGCHIEEAIIALEGGGAERRVSLPPAPDPTCDYCKTADAEFTCPGRSDQIPERLYHEPHAFCAACDKGRGCAMIGGPVVEKRKESSGIERVCPDCWGDGDNPIGDGARREKCLKCNGTGKA